MGARVLTRISLIISKIEHLFLMLSITCHFFLFSVNCLSSFCPYCVVIISPSGSFWARNSFPHPGYKVIPLCFLLWFHILHSDPIWNLSWYEIRGVYSIIYFPTMLQHYLLRNLPFSSVSWILFITCTWISFWLFISFD